MYFMIGKTKALRLLILAPLRSLSGGIKGSKCLQSRVHPFIGRLKCLWVAAMTKRLMYGPLEFYSIR